GHGSSQGRPGAKTQKRDVARDARTGEPRPDGPGNAYGTIQSRTGVDCSTTINAMRASSTRLHPRTLRKMSPSRPAIPTAAAAAARFCGLTILPSTPPDEFAAAIRTGSSPALAAVCTWSAPNSALAEVSEPVTATPIRP